MTTIDHDTGEIAIEHPALIRLDTATRLLAEANGVDEVKNIRDKAEALRLYLRQQHAALEAQNHCAEIKLRAERRAGEILAVMPDAKTGPKSELHDSVSVNSTPKLADLGISYKQSERWQSIAALPEAIFETYIESSKANSDELTTAGALRLVKEIKHQERTDEKIARARTLPTGIYNVIYADPPWEYSNTGVHGAADHHYPTMSTADIARLLDDIPLSVAANAVLFLWVTNPILTDALSVIDAWDFEYKTNVVWVKTDLKKPGSGFYVRGRHELLFICTRGSFTPLDQHISPPIGSVITAPVADHSAKPSEVYSIIERLYPDCSYIELFARQERAGWDGYGYDYPG